MQKIVTENIARESRLHTDESKLYDDAAEDVRAHRTVQHTADEYVRHDVDLGDDDKMFVETVHTNSAEGYFSIFKRGMRGIISITRRAVCTRGSCAGGREYLNVGLTGQ